MKNLILDLTGNGGGILQTASDIADQFLGAGKLVVYTEGRNQPRQELRTTSAGSFEDGRLVILVDEGSASASEIVAGAVQDWDRGIVVGRRTFGKGLVQRQLPLPDGTMIRLTVARYYTPTGRSIQKPYREGHIDEYHRDFYNRLQNGEMMHVDSIRFPDSLKFRTLVNGRTVYGGGGIMLKSYPDVRRFKSDYAIPESMIDRMKEMAHAEKLEWNDEQFRSSEKLIKLQIKALMARDLFDSSAYFVIINDENDIFREGLRIIGNSSLYSKLLKGTSSVASK
jgi:carboxyl-terminal processing protease